MHTRILTHNFANTKMKYLILFVAIAQAVWTDDCGSPMGSNVLLGKPEAGNFVILMDASGLCDICSVTYFFTGETFGIGGSDKFSMYFVTPNQEPGTALSESPAFTVGKELPCHDQRWVPVNVDTQGQGLMVLLYCNNDVFDCSVDFYISISEGEVQQDFSTFSSTKPPVIDESAADGDSGSSTNVCAENYRVGDYCVSESDDCDLQCGARQYVDYFCCKDYVGDFGARVQSSTCSCTQNIPVQNTQTTLTISLLVVIGSIF